MTTLPKTGIVVPSQGGAAPWGTPGVNDAMGKFDDIIGHTIWGGTSDDTAEVQGKFSAIGTTGEKIQALNRIYRLSGTVDVKSQTHYEGRWGGLTDTSTRPPTQGSVYRWIGAVGGIMFRALGTEFAHMEGFHLDGASVVGLTALLISSTNTPPTHDLSFERFTITDVSGTGSAAIRVGAAVSTYQMDALSFNRFRIESCLVGIESNSGNGMDDSLITNGSIIGILPGGFGIHGNRIKGITVISTAFAGTDATSTAVQTESDHTAMVFINCDFEMPSGGKCLVINGGAGTYVGPVSLFGCTLSGNIELNAPHQVVTLTGGEMFGDIWLNGANTRVINIGCRMLGTVHEVGAGSLYQDLTPNDGPGPMLTFPSTQDLTIAEFRARGPAGTGVAPGVRINNAVPGSGGQAWDMISGGTGFAPGEFLVRDPVTSLNVLRLGPGQKTALNGNDPIAKRALPAAATDAATTQALVNAIRAYLIDHGDCS